MHCSGTTARVIITSVGRFIRKSWNLTFPQSNKTFHFSINAPEVPSHSQIYLLSGYWDNNGNIGSYFTFNKSRISNSPTNHEYKGEPLLIGSGSVVKGTIIEDGKGNQINNQAETRGTLEWRWDTEKFELKVNQNRTPITVETKNNQVIIKDRNSAVIYRQVLNNPKTKVICGNNCPQGFLKCCSDNYPGYCCIPCNEIKGDFQQMRNLIRRFNHG